MYGSGSWWWWLTPVTPLSPATVFLQCVSVCWCAPNESKKGTICVPGVRKIKPPFCVVYDTHHFMEMFYCGEFLPQTDQLHWTSWTRHTRLPHSVVRMMWPEWNCFTHSWQWFTRGSCQKWNTVYGARSRLLPGLHQNSTKYYYYTLLVNSSIDEFPIY